MHGVDERSTLLIALQTFERDKRINRTSTPHLSMHRITCVVGRAVRGGNAWCRRHRIPAIALKTFEA
jgi:hypothetical protein